MDVLIVGDGEVARELVPALVARGYGARLIRIEALHTALRAVSPQIVVVGDGATDADADAVFRAFGRGKPHWPPSVVVLGEVGPSVTGALRLPLCLSAQEIVRQIVGATIAENVEAAADDAPRAGRTATMAALRSYCLLAAEGQLHIITDGPARVMGRASTNAIVLDDLSISRRHASVEIVEEGLLLRDLGSANGVRVNGAPVVEQLLKHGDSVQIGCFLFRVVAGNRTAALNWKSARQASTEEDVTLTDDTAQSARIGGLQGDLKAIDLITLIQMLVAQRRSGTLTLTRGGRKLGSVFLAHGQVLHAEASDGLKGEDAFYALLPIETAQFTFRLEVGSQHKTIHTAPTALLLEGCRRLDEARAR